MGKFRVRVNRKGAPGWGPGQSSSSNAPVTKFRDQARALRIANQTPLVAVDEQMEQGGPDDVTDQIGLEEMNIDETTVGARTVVSQYTSCTNPTFNPINRIWNDDDAEKQQDVLNLLAFAADTIREKQGDQSDVEYYGVLLAALDDIPTEDVKKIYANSYLLHLLFPKIPKELLIKHFDRVKPILDRKLQVLATDKNAYGAIKFLLSSLGSLLKAQPQAFWSTTEHKAILSDLVGFSFHPHPGVRMISRRTIRALLTEEPHVAPNAVHPGAKTVAKAAKEQLDTCNGNRDTITRLLCLLEGILHKMPDTTLASLLEYLLQLGSSGDTTVRCSAYQCIQRTLEKPPSVESLPINRNAELIVALRSQQIPTDVSVFAYWLQTLTEAHCCLSQKTSEKSVNLLPDTLELFGKAFQVPNADLGYAVHLSLNRLMSDCIKDNAQASQKCLDVLERSFNVQNTDVWKHIFASMAILIEQVGEKIDGNIFIKVLQTLSTMREKDGCICAKDIERVIASAIKNVGMAKVMGIIELGLNPTAPELPTDFARSWMLPLLIHNVRNERISFFTSSVIPVLVALHERLSKLTDMNGKLYHALELQIWEILPHLLDSPVDFPESFPILAPMIGSALAQRLDLRIVLLKALRSALRFADKNGHVEVVKKYAKNYLPILFNIYTVSLAETMEIVKSQNVRNYDDRAVRLSTLETVRSYILQTPEEVKNNFTATALSKLTSDDQKMTVEKKQAITDLVIALVRGMDADQFAEVFNVIRDWFTSGLGSFQKKAYRVLSEMYKRINEPQLRPFFEKNAPFVQDLIAKGFEGVQKPSRGPRIGVYRSILTTFKEYDELKHFVDSILEQVILSQDKSFSKTTREQAAHCFLQICDKLVDFGSDADITPSAALEPILTTIAQLYNEPPSGKEEISLEQARSALISLNMITQKYVKFLNPTVLDKLINMVCATLYDLRNPIKILAVRCTRILCNKLQQFAMSQYRDNLLKHIFEQDFTVHSLKVRKANRLLLEVLVDRYGHELLLKATEKDDFVKQIKHIAKMKRRKERRAAGMQAEEEDDDDEVQSTFTTANTVKADTIFDILEDSDEEGDEEKIKSFDNKSAVLNEDEDEVVDLLDRDTYIQKLSTVDSRIKKKVTIEDPKKDETFRVDKQGRIMIVNIDKKRKRYNSEMFEEDDEEVEAKSVEDEVAEEQKEDIHSVVASTYKPGGRGIHRQTAHSGAMSYVSNATTTNGKAKMSDHKKKEDKFEPYAYIPLRNKGRSNGLKSILKKKSNKGGRKSNVPEQVDMAQRMYVSGDLAMAGKNRPASAARGASRPSSTQAGRSPSSSSSLSFSLLRQSPVTIKEMPKPLTQPLNTSQNGSSIATFDDEENVIITVLIALHDHVLANTASTGPTMDAKNRVWDLIRERLCNRNGAIQRTDEQVRNRWRSLRSSYAFKQDKARHLAEMFYKRLASNHKIRLEDIAVPGIKFPLWLQNMIRNDPNFKPGVGGKPVVVKKREQQRSLSIGKNTDEPVNKKRRTLPPTKTEPALVDQEAETFVFKKIIFPTDEYEEQEKPSNSTPSSVHEELNSVTESGANTPSVNEDEYETEVEANYRRKEELHQAQLALLNAKRREVDMRMKLTHLQIQAFLRQNGSLFDFPVEEPSANNEVEEVEKSQMFDNENEEIGEAEVPNVSASEPIDTATDGGQEG